MSGHEQNIGAAEGEPIPVEVEAVYHDAEGRQIGRRVWVHRGDVTETYEEGDCPPLPEDEG